jgi:cell division septation protein DedD
MVRKNEREPAKSRRPRGAVLLRFVYGAGLVALGTCLGIVIGSLSETPRLVLERLRGPVKTVEIASPAAETLTRATPKSSLERFGELQEGKSPRPANPVPAAKAIPAAEAEPPPPLVPPSELATPPVAAAPPVAPAGVEVTAAVQPPGAVVQVASYVERKPADSLVVKLKNDGFDAYVSQPAAANGRYRVRIRPTTGEAAGDLAKRLSGLGFETWATSE